MTMCDEQSEFRWNSVGWTSHSLPTKLINLLGGFWVDSKLLVSAFPKVHTITRIIASRKLCFILFSFSWSQNRAHQNQHTKWILAELSHCVEHDSVRRSSHVTHYFMRVALYTFFWPTDGLRNHFFYKFYRFSYAKQWNGVRYRSAWFTRFYVTLRGFHYKPILLSAYQITQLFLYDGRTNRLMTELSQLTAALNVIRTHHIRLLNCVAAYFVISSSSVYSLLERTNKARLVTTYRATRERKREKVEESFIAFNFAFSRSQSARRRTLQSENLRGKSTRSADVKNIIREKN